MSKPIRPFDLHVSCSPPAFILSQDQTLQNRHDLAIVLIPKGQIRAHFRAEVSYHSSVVKVQRPARRPAAQSSDEGAGRSSCQTGKAPRRPTRRPVRRRLTLGGTPLGGGARAD